MALRPIIVKKVKKAAHEHHGGAWKIAYADFVTAMMAFFLLMWLISMTTQEQKNGLAEYFAPAALSPATSGAGGMLYGTALDTSGNKSSTPRDAARGAAEHADTARPTSPGRPSDVDASRPAVGAQANYSAIASLRQALEKMPEVAELSRNIRIEPTNEGVNVSLVDEDGSSMFPEGSSRPNDRTRRLLERLAPVIRKLPNRIAITGYTATPRPGTRPPAPPWELSANRAISVRETLAGSGVPDDRFTSVTGKADTEPMFPDNPFLAPNRRVTITLLNGSLPVPPDLFR